MRPLFRRLRVLLLLALIAPTAVSLKGITVSGRVTESDTAPVAGVTITVEQIGGELPLFTTQTGIDGTWAVRDPFLTGNIRVTASSSSFAISPAKLDSFTFDNLADQNFTATPTVPRANIGVFSGFERPIFTGGSHSLAPISLGGTSAPAFIIRNNGTLPLSNISMTVTGAPPGEFVVELAPATTLAPNGVTVATVRLNPTATGLRAATVLIHSDDPNENPFVVQLSGLVVSIEVTNTTDSGPGSLRQAIFNTTLTDGYDTILFHPSLSGQTITVSNEIPVDALGEVVIDARSLPGGLTLRGVGITRILRARSNTLQVAGLVFTGGNQPAFAQNDSGGAIVSEGHLLVYDCTFSNNVAAFKGGAIACVGTFAQLTVSNCTFLCNTGGNGGAVACKAAALITQSTFACNSGSFGGALYTEGNTTVERSTISGNSGNAGGGITYSASLTLNHCTISENTAKSGAGLYSPNSSVASCNFSIVAGNHPFKNPNVIGVLINNSSLLEGSPLLAPLDNYGGSTKTMALLVGSPARNAATNSSAKYDQRGFPIVGVPDIGAYEAGTSSNFNAFIWERLPSNATSAQHDADIDFDADGADNFTEWLALTDPADASSTFRIIRIAPTQFNTVEITFESSADRHYQVETSTNLIDWVPEPAIVAGTGALMTLPIASAKSTSRKFVRMRATL